MSASLLAGLARRVREASASTARAVVLQASGPHFCTGGRYAGKPGAAPWWLKARGVYGPSVVLDAFRRLPLASTTVCHGTSVGGGFLLGIAADLRVSTVSARFRLGVSPHGLEQDTPLMDAGIDSLSAADLVRQLSAKFSVELPATTLFDYPSASAIATHVTRAVPAVELDLVEAPLRRKISIDATRPEQTRLSTIALRLPLALMSTRDLVGSSQRALSVASSVPVARWDSDSVQTKGLNGDQRLRLRYGAFLRGVLGCDAPCFRVRTSEAAAMDPQQHAVLSVGYAAMSARGRVRSSLANEDVGTTLGMMNTDHARSVGRIPGPYDMTGNGAASAGARLSFTFALRGPCVAMDTACSSSLVATHVACRLIEHDECDDALSVGTNLILTWTGAFATFAVAGMLSTGGRCHTFDARADGYQRGEGTVALWNTSEAATLTHVG